jgi:hypothetical protein
MNTSFRVIGRLVLTGLAVLLPAGCRTAPPAHTQVDVQLDDQEAYRQFWLHAIRSVRHFGYELDRADPAAGVITTHPLTSKQWFEFWRNDTLAADQVAQASLHTIRRSVRLTVQPAATTNEYTVDAVVNIERQERPEQQVTTAANALQAFNPRILARNSSSGMADAGTYWEDLGRDSVLEAALLKRVARWPGAKVVIAAASVEASGTSADQPPPEAEPAALTPPAHQ